MVGRVGGRVMYCHPSQVKKWAKAMKPDPTPAQIEQAQFMRKAKQAKREFLRLQKPLF